MKKVVSNDMVAHLWANKSQDEARNGTGSIYFNGDTIYSYGGHFPMAQHYKGVVLENDDSYSPSTGKHQNLVRNAVTHLTRIPVIEFGTDKHIIENNFSYYDEKILEFCKKAERCRSESNFNWNMTRANHYKNSGNAYSKLMKRKRTFEILDSDGVKKAIKIDREKERKILEDRKQRELALKKEALVYLNIWLKGGAKKYSLQSLPCELRLKNDTVETSHGAEFPVSHGKRVYKAIKKHIQDGTSFQRNGHAIRIGSFQIDSIASNGDVKAGCHFVKFEAIERFAKKMGW